MNESKLVLTKEEICLNISLPKTDSGVNEWHISLQPRTQDPTQPPKPPSQSSLSHPIKRERETLEKLFEAFYSKVEYICGSRKTNLSFELRQDIIEFFASFPQLQADSDARWAFLYPAALDQELISRIKWDSPGAQFVSHIIGTLVSYGNLHDNRNALIAVLQGPAQQFGTDRQKRAEDLIKRLVSNSGYTTASRIVSKIQNLLQYKDLLQSKELEALVLGKRKFLTDIICELESLVQVLSPSGNEFHPRYDPSEEQPDEQEIQQVHQRIYSTVTSLKNFVKKDCPALLTR